MKAYNNKLIRLYNQFYNYYKNKQYKITLTHFIDVCDFSVSEKQKMGANSNETVWYLNIKRLVKQFDNLFNQEEYNLIDIGSGFGNALIYFDKNYFFKSFTGIEFEKSFVIESQKQFKRLNIEHINIEYQDCSKYQLSDKPHFIFMFNSLKSDSLKSFIKLNHQNMKKNKSVFAYVNFSHIDVFETFEAKINYINNNFRIALISF